MSVTHRGADAFTRPQASRPEVGIAVRWRFSGGVLEISATREPGGAVRVEAAVVTSEDRRVVRTVGPLEASVWRTDDDGLEHIEAGPTLRLTMRAETGPDDETRVLFAQTDVLEAIGLVGGRYDRPM